MRLRRPGPLRRAWYTVSFNVFVLVCLIEEAWRERRAPLPHPDVLC